MNAERERRIQEGWLRLAEQFASDSCLEDPVVEALT